MDMLAGLPPTTITTRSPWDKEPRRFTGPLLRDVLAAAGAQGSRLPDNQPMRVRVTAYRCSS
jgi:hypothetical protein